MNEEERIINFSLTNISFMIEISGRRKKVETVGEQRKREGRLKKKRDKEWCWEKMKKKKAPNKHSFITTARQNNQSAWPSTTYHHHQLTLPPTCQKQTSPVKRTPSSHSVTPNTHTHFPFHLPNTKPTRPLWFDDVCPIKLYRHPSTMTWHSTQPIFLIPSILLLFLAGCHFAPFKLFSPVTCHSSSSIIPFLRPCSPSFFLLLLMKVTPGSSSIFLWKWNHRIIRIRIRISEPIFSLFLIFWQFYRFFNLHSEIGFKSVKTTNRSSALQLLKNNFHSDHNRDYLFNEQTVPFEENDGIWSWIIRWWIMIIIIKRIIMVKWHGRELREKRGRTKKREGKRDWKMIMMTIVVEEVLLLLLFWEE